MLAPLFLAWDGEQPERRMYHGERFNSVTHLAGAALSVAGMIWLVTQAVESADTWKIVSFTVFGVTMVLLYAASTLYHSWRGPAKEIWAKVDHCAIYLLIAGTYTPFTLVTLRGLWGWVLFAAVWLLALLGIAKELWLGREKVPSVPLYLGMGWVGIAAAVPLYQGLQGEGLFWLLVGAVLYTVGVIFYALDKRWRHAHGVWHLFVLGGTSAHYFTILRFVA